MAIKETIYLHRKHRVCTGNSGAQKVWNRYSFWTHASDVEFDDGTTLDTKISNIKGISNDINAGAGYAADVSLVKSIRDSLKSLIDNLSNVVNSINNRLGGLRFYEDSNGKWVVGADSVPKKLGSGLGSLKKIIYMERQGADESGKLLKITDGDDVVFSATEFSAGDYFDVVRNIYESKEGSHNYSLNKWFDDYKFKLSGLFPNDYRNWTENNFILHITDSQMYCYHESSNNLGGPKRFQRNYTYNPNAGELTVHNVTGGTAENSEVDNAGDGFTSYYVYGFELWIIT